ncbi:MAG: hypothetical protein HYV40_01030 [Candidatus Levybacteria bacterium]|nr:hypothetical protein [Candidatus Levybacteria bacterium]
MAKHRKTRKEKIRSEQRQQHVMTPAEVASPAPQEKTPFQFTFSAQTTPKTTPSPLLKQNEHHAFVWRDLRKIGIVTTSIVAVELVLFLLI